MRILIWILVAYLLYRIFKGRRQVAAEKAEKARPAAETYQDPICGVFVSEADAVVGVLDGTRHYFCSRGCLERFQEQISQSATPNQSGGK